MSQRKDIIQCALVIHQDKRMVGIITAGISTGAFAFVLIAVNPAAVHAFIQQLNVRFTKGCQSAADNLHGFVKRNGCMFTGYKRRIDIIHMQFLYAKHFAAKTDIAVHFRKGIMNRFDQLVINSCRNIVLRQMGFHGGGIMSGFCIEQFFFQIGSKNGSHGVFILVKGTVVGLENFAAKISVRTFKERNKTSVGDADFIALTICDTFKPDIRIVEHIKNGLRGAVQVHSQGHEGLFLF